MKTVPAEQVREAYSRLPVPIREFLVEDDLGAVIQKLSGKYNLHVDTMGLLAESISKMLLGFTSPQELTEELSNLLQFTPEATKAFISDLNTEIFMPLQKRIKEEGAGPSLEERLKEPEPEDEEEVVAVPDRTPAVPVMGIDIKQAVPPNLPGQTALPQPVQPPVPIPVAAPIPPQPPAFIPSIPPTPVYQAPPQPAPAIPIYSNPQPPAPVQPTAPVAPVQQYRPTARTMESDMQQVSQGYLPTYDAPAAPPVYVAPPPAPAPAARPPVVASPVPPPAPVASDYPPPAMASVRLTPVDRPHANAPITKEYGSDPYREPIE